MNYKNNKVIYWFETISILYIIVKPFKNKMHIDLAQAIITVYVTLKKNYVSESIWDKNVIN